MFPIKDCCGTADKRMVCEAHALYPSKRFVNIKSRHLAELALIRVGSVTTLPRKRIKKKSSLVGSLRLWSVLLSVLTLKSPSKTMSLPSRPSVHVFKIHPELYFGVREAIYASNFQGSRFLLATNVEPN